jgi:DNA recombination protein RmuC
VKLRVDEVAKYIRPDNGTLDFALMYVPAENVFYETIAGAEAESPMTYALGKRVHLCSPNTFHAFLQVVLRGFRGLKVQEEAKEIMGRLDLFKREFAKFHKEFEVLGTHVGRAKNKYDEIDNIAGRLTDKLEIEVPVQSRLLEDPQPKLLEPEESLVPEPLRLRPRD